MRYECVVHGSFPSGDTADSEVMSRGLTFQCGSVVRPLPHLCCNPGSQVVTLTWELG